MNVRKNTLITLGGLSLTGLLALTACGGETVGNGSVSDGGGAAAGGYAELSGNLAAAGASSMQNAQTAWTETFMGLVGAEGGDVELTYDATGSGTGREQFLNGEVAFAGSDAAMDEQELASSAAVCNGEQAFNIPVYISPIAVVFNLDGVDELNLTPEAIGGIFAGDITNWTDPAIADHNPDVDLPDQAIVPVHRSDDSGTTENFTDYLSETAPAAWSHGVVETWPLEGGQSGDGTSGMISTVEGGHGTIGYADASQAGTLGVASIQVGQEFVPYSAEAAAAAVDVSPREEGREDHDVVMQLARETTESGTYPIVLVAYMIMCGSYEDQATADNVKAYASYVVSEDGQQVSAENAGSAPLTEGLREDAQAAIDAITAG